MTKELKKTKSEPLFVGQILFKREKSAYDGGSIKEYKITKIGKKYFECEGLRHRFNISNLTYECKDYSQFNYTLYRSIKEIEEEDEYNNLLKQIREDFRSYKLSFTLEQLRKINLIITEQEK
jgi:DNA-binding MarR family transcriptional regulator